jgi:hypothetical protein
MSTSNQPGAGGAERPSFFQAAPRQPVRRKPLYVPTEIWETIRPGRRRERSRFHDDFNPGFMAMPSTRTPWPAPPPSKKRQPSPIWTASQPLASPTLRTNLMRPKSVSRPFPPPPLSVRHVPPPRHRDQHVFAHLARDAAAAQLVAQPSHLLPQHKGLNEIAGFS